MKGWRMPEGAVYVGRPSKWGNPCVVERDRADRWSVYATDVGPSVGRDLSEMGARTEAVREFVTWLESGDGAAGRPDDLGLWRRQRDALVAALPELAGRDLACWCPLDSPCHADVLLELANGGGR